MGVNLRLLAIDSPTLGAKETPCAYLDINRNEKMFSAILDLDSRPISACCLSTYFGCTEEDGTRTWGPTETDEYGEELRWVKADDLASCMIEFKYGESNDRLFDYKTDGALMYIMSLFNDCPIVLYWW